MRVFSSPLHFWYQTSGRERTSGGALAGDVKVDEDSLKFASFAQILFHYISATVLAYLIVLHGKY